MEFKKSKKANLENKRGIFFKTGLSVILLLLIFSFNYKTTNKISELDFGTSLIMLDDEDMIITRRKNDVKPPKPKVVEQIKIVDDKQYIDDELEIPDVETSEIDSIPIDIDLTDEKVPDIFEPYIVEERADFIGGPSMLNKFLVNNIKYPPICKENRIEGKVILKFIVNSSGEVSDIEIAKHADKHLENEAIRVLSKSPKWKPAKQNGKKVAMYFYLPVNFELAN